MKNKFFVYRFLDTYGNVNYVGKTNNLDRRMREHFNGEGHCDKECYDTTYKVEYIPVYKEINAYLVETYFMNKYKAKYNKLNMCYKDKSFTDDEVMINPIPSENWNLYKVMNPNLAPTPVLLPKNLTFKENLIFYIVVIITMIIYTIFYPYIENMLP